MIRTAVDTKAMLPIAKPTIGDAELEAVRRPLGSGWLTQGPEVATSVSDGLARPRAIMGSEIAM